MGGIEHLSRGIIEDLGSALAGPAQDANPRSWVFWSRPCRTSAAPSRSTWRPRRRKAWAVVSMGDRFYGSPAPILLTAVGPTENAIATNIAIIQEPGIRRTQDFLQSHTPLPPLWSVWLN